MTFPEANSGKNCSALHRGVWGSAVHHHLCPWSTELCAIAIIQTTEGEPKVCWSRGEANPVGNAPQPFNPLKAPL